MSLKIYCASRIEKLAEKLKERLLNDRQGKDPFLSAEVVVPNVNVAKWLQIRMFAKVPTLCAGIRFPFMEKALTELMLTALPNDERAEVELLPEHELAYAMTVHKSQGSEFGNVMVVLPNDGEHPLLNRQIVYTGITRAKKRAVIVGPQGALDAALARQIVRDTGLASRK